MEANNKQLNPSELAFLRYVMEELRREFNVYNPDKLINESHFIEFVMDDPETAMHDSPYDWAEWIYKNFNKDDYNPPLIQTKTNVQVLYLS